MSGSTAWTWRHAIAKSDLPAETRHVLLTLSLWMNELGEGCYPSIADLVDATARDKKTVRKHLDHACEKGWLVSEQLGLKGQRWRRKEYKARWPERDIEATTSSEGGGPVPPPSNAEKVGEPVPEGGGTGSPKVGEQVPQDNTSPEDSSNTSPVERERASAQDDGDREGRQDVDAEAGASRDAVKRAFRKAFREWPSFVADSEPEAMKAWFALSPEERELASAEIARYVEAAKAGGRKAVCSFAVYLREKRWEKLPEQPAAAGSQGGQEPTRPDGWAAGFGPVWAARLHAVLLAGPDHPDRAPPDIPIIAGEAFWLASQLAQAWPSLAALVNGKGRVFEPQWHALKDAIEFVPSTGPVYADWRDEYARRGWPWPKGAPGMDGLWFPKGGPDGLKEFNEAVRRTAGGANQEAAE